MQPDERVRTDAARETHARDLQRDQEVASRTQYLLQAAEQISAELTLQTEKLAGTVSLFNREVVEPLRKLQKDEIS